MFNSLWSTRRLDKFARDFAAAQPLQVQITIFHIAWSKKKKTASSGNNCNYSQLGSDLNLLARSI